LGFGALLSEFGTQKFNIKPAYQQAGVKLQTSNIKRQTRNVKHQTSNKKRQTSNLQSAFFTYSPPACDT
jgi:hypothetical protein